MPVWQLSGLLRSEQMLQLASDTMLEQQKMAFAFGLNPRFALAVTARCCLTLAVRRLGADSEVQRAFGWTNKVCSAQHAPNAVEQWLPMHTGVPNCDHRAYLLASVR